MKQKNEKDRPAKATAFVIRRSYVGKRNFSDMVIDLIFSAYGKCEAENKSKKAG